MNEDRRCARFPFPSIYDPASVYLSIIVPAYNEQDRMPSMLHDTLRHLEKRQRQDPKFTFEIIIVDDGSRDDTPQVAIGFVRKYSSKVVR